MEPDQDEPSECWIENLEKSRLPTETAAVAQIPRICLP